LTVNHQEIAGQKHQFFVAISDNFVTWSRIYPA